MTKYEILDILLTIRFVADGEPKGYKFSLASLLMGIATLDHSERIAEYFMICKDVVKFDLGLPDRLSFSFDMGNLPEDGGFTFDFSYGRCYYEVGDSFEMTDSFIECFIIFLDKAIQYVGDKYE